MLQPIAGETDRLVRHLNNRIKDKGAEGACVNVRDILQAFTMDVIGKCAYNVEFGCLKDDRLESPKIFTDLKGYIDSQNLVPDAMTSAIYVLVTVFPKLNIWLENYPKEMFDCEYIQGVSHKIK